MTLFDVIFRLFQFVLDEIQRRSLSEITDGKDRCEDLLQAHHRFDPIFRPNQHLQKALIRTTLNLDEVRHHSDLGDSPEALANSFATRE